MPFQLCCIKPDKIPYDILHNKLEEQVKAELASMLWYLPEVSSYQSAQNTLFSNPSYDAYLFHELTYLLGLSEDDIFYETGRASLEDRYGEYYTKEICTNCQKALFVQSKGKTQTASFFKNLRDCIAHGCFNLVGEYFIAFNHPKFNGERYTAVFKLKYKNMIKALHLLEHKTREKIYEQAFENLGYHKIDPRYPLAEEDLCVEKDGIRFRLEFKNFTGRFIAMPDVEKCIDSLKNLDRYEYITILVADLSYTSSKINKYISDNRAAVLDRKGIKEMLAGKDKLMEIARNQHLI